MAVANAASDAGLSVWVMVGAAPRVSVTLPATASVRDLKTAIVLQVLPRVHAATPDAPPLPPHVTMRLLYMGRELRPEVRKLRDLHVTEGCVIQALTSATTGSTTGALPTTASAHVAVSVPAHGGEDEGVSEAQVDAQGEHTAAGRVGEASDAAPAHRAGFDRLLGLGLSAAEVSIVRNMYLNDVVNDMRPRVPMLPGETHAAHLLRMEDEWIRRQGPHSEFMLNLRPVLHARQSPALSLWASATQPRQRGAGPSDDDDDDTSGHPSSAGSGTLGSFLCGVACGSFLGIFMLVWLLQPTVTKRFKYGVLVGVVINIMSVLLSTPVPLPASGKDDTAGALGEVTTGKTGVRYNPFDQAASSNSAAAAAAAAAANELVAGTASPSASPSALVSTM